MQDDTSRYGVVGDGSERCASMRGGAGWRRYCTFLSVRVGSG